MFKKGTAVFVPTTWVEHEAMGVMLDEQPEWTVTKVQHSMSLDGATYNTSLEMEAANPSYYPDIDMDLPHVKTFVESGREGLPPPRRALGYVIKGEL